MHSTKILIFLLVAAIIGTAGASTVTLTGTCYSGIISDKSNYIQFNLTNSGDGAATNLVITPMISGAMPNNTTVSIPLVKPNTTYGEKIYLWNFTTVGSYVELFLVSYSQGTSTFTTVYPCLATFFKGAQSQLVVTGLTKNTSKVVVNVSDTATYPITASATVYASSAFNVTPLYQNFTINPRQIKRIPFDVVPPQYTNAEFPVTIGISYIHGGVHYATLAITTVTFPNSLGFGLSLETTLLIIGLLAAIIIVVALVIVSIIVNRRRKRGQRHEGYP